PKRIIMRLLQYRPCFMTQAKVIKINQFIALIAHINIGITVLLGFYRVGIYQVVGLWRIGSIRYWPDQAGSGVVFELLVEEEHIQLGLGRIVAAAGIVGCIEQVYQGRYARKS